MNMEYYVYVLRCSDGSYYTGVTNNYEKRLQEHQNGNDIKSYTFSRRPVRLVHLETFTEISWAIEREKQIKPWSRHKKEALIQENYQKLQIFSKKKFKD